MEGDTQPPTVRAAIGSFVEATGRALVAIGEADALGWTSEGAAHATEMLRQLEARAAAARNHLNMAVIMGDIQ